jgi:acyl carrier protein
VHPPDVAPELESSPRRWSIMQHILSAGRRRVELGRPAAEGRTNMPQRCSICEAPLSGRSSLCPDCEALLRWFRGYFAHDPSLVLERIGPETRFVQDLGADSLDYMDWLVEAEEKLGVAIPDREAERLGIGTVGQFLRYVREHGAAWPSDLEIRLVRRGNCWRSYRWNAVPRAITGETAG